MYRIYVRGRRLLYPKIYEHSKRNVPYICVGQGQAFRYDVKQAAYLLLEGENYIVYQQRGRGHCQLCIDSLASTIKYIYSQYSPVAYYRNVKYR